MTADGQPSNEGACANGHWEVSRPKPLSHLGNIRVRKQVPSELLQLRVADILEFVSQQSSIRHPSGETFLLCRCKSVPPSAIKTALRLDEHPSLTTSTAEIQVMTPTEDEKRFDDEKPEVPACLRFLDGAMSEDPRDEPIRNLDQPIRSSDSPLPECSFQVSLYGRRDGSRIAGLLKSPIDFKGKQCRYFRLLCSRERPTRRLPDAQLPITEFSYKHTAKFR